MDRHGKTPFLAAMHEAVRARNESAAKETSSSARGHSAPSCENGAGVDTEEGAFRRAASVVAVLKWYGAFIVLVLYRSVLHWHHTVIARVLAG